MIQNERGFETSHRRKRELAGARLAAVSMKAAIRSVGIRTA